MPANRTDTSRSPSVSQARWLILAAALLWSTSGFFVKSPDLAGWTGPRLAFWRATFACLALWPLVRRPSWSWRLVPMMVLFVGMNYTYLTAMVKGSAANAIWLQCTAPVWVLLVGVFVFGERAIVRDWLMVAFAALGIGIIVYFESRGVALDAVAWALASSFFYAGVVLSLRQLRGFNAVWMAALNHLATAVVLAPLAFADSSVPQRQPMALSCRVRHSANGNALCALRPRIEANSRPRGHRHRTHRTAAQSDVGAPGLG